MQIYFTAIYFICESVRSKAKAEIVRKLSLRAVKLRKMNFGAAKTESFTRLVAETNGCRLCENMHGRTAVLSELNGSPHAEILFIAEAPGRNGGDKTRIPLAGDASGNNFQKFIDSINLKRADIFITNSVLCNPRKESGANRKPSKKEISNCSGFLRRQLELLNPRLVVTLGSVALEALKTIEFHQLTLKNDAGKILNWNGKFLVPLYHPSPQVLASHRRIAAQLEDYQAVAQAIILISQEPIF